MEQSAKEHDDPYIRIWATSLLGGSRVHPIRTKSFAGKSEDAFHTS